MKKTQEARSPVYFYKENIRINEDPLYKRGDRLGISDKKMETRRYLFYVLAIVVLCYLELSHCLSEYYSVDHNIQDLLVFVTLFT